MGIFRFVVECIIFIGESRVICFSLLKEFYRFGKVFKVTLVFICSFFFYVGGSAGSVCLVG